jgi:hypothetical protein
VSFHAVKELPFALKSLQLLPPSQARARQLISIKLDLEALGAVLSVDLAHGDSWESSPSRMINCCLMNQVVLVFSS